LRYTVEIAYQTQRQTSSLLAKGTKKNICRKAKENWDAHNVQLSMEDGPLQKFPAGHGLSS
jgi:hypothetical protein